MCAFWGFIVNVKRKSFLLTASYTLTNFAIRNLKTQKQECVSVSFQSKTNECLCSFVFLPVSSAWVCLQDIIGGKWETKKHKFPWGPYSSCCLASTSSESRLTATLKRKWISTATKISFFEELTWRIWKSINFSNDNALTVLLLTTVSI